MPGALFLRSHVFLCRANRHWVILDVNRDKYLCVDRGQFESLGPWISGWEEPQARGIDSAAAEPPPAAIALAKNLLNLDILSERAPGTKDARATSYGHPTSAADLDTVASVRRSRCVNALPFWLSSARASRQLREQPFESIVASVRTRKRANENPARPLDIQRARSLTALFESLRLFYPRPYLCLFDSLALIHFLARFDLYPDWVFAVRADPFEAHCWVQAGNIVLNDSVERVSALTPIMSV